MNANLKIYLSVFTALFFLMFIQDSFAVGALYVRPRFSSDQYQKMWIKNINVNVDIQDQVAVTSVDQTFYNEMNTSVEAIYIFPLPENAMITKLVYWFNGQQYEAEIRERQEAVADYNSKVRQWMDPALLEYLGNNVFKLSVVPVNALSEVRTEITYVEMLKYDFGTIDYNFLLNTMQLSSKPVETVHLFVDARSQNEFKYFRSPTHSSMTATKITKLSLQHYSLEYGDENFYPNKDLLLEFETVRNKVQFNILTYTPSIADSMGTNSFYALWITPPDTITGDEVIPKDLVFTVDVSSSMEGTRLDQVKQALNEFLNLLSPVDRFNIITFGTFTAKFKPDLVEASANNIYEAKSFVANLYALGLTNIDNALIESLGQSYGDQSSNDLIFLTDGQPTWGVVQIDSIINHTIRNNKKDVRIFSFGVGDDISKSLLEGISNQNHGYAQYITEDDSISLVITNHFNRISKPVLRNLTVDMGGLHTWDIYPKTLSDLYWGSQITQLGLYDNSGDFTVTLNGELKSNPFTYNSTITFAETLGGHRFIPRLWAKAKIDDILKLIALYGEKKELVDQVIELSLRFQVLTPYSAFYSDPTTVVENENSLPEDFVLKQNYPNPFNPETVIEYSLPSIKASYNVTIKIYNALGQLVRVLVNANQTSGNYKVVWDGRDSFGKALASGVYIYTISAGEFMQAKKMILLR
jgi:Ca-activated chloride channel homolog